MKVFITEVLFQSVRKTRLYELGVKLWDITDIRNEKWNRVFIPALGGCCLRSACGFVKTPAISEYKSCATLNCRYHVTQSLILKQRERETRETETEKKTETETDRQR